MSKNKIIILNDSVGRLIVGEKVKEDAKTIGVKCPTIINVSQTENNEMALQLAPYAYIDLLEGFGVDHVWSFPKTSTVVSDGKLRERALEMYEQTVQFISNKNAQAIQQEAKVGSKAPEVEGQVVDMFDKEGN